MHRVGVGGRMHGDRRDAELLRGAQDAQRDFAAIGDEDFVEHCAVRRLFDHEQSGSPYSTGWPSSTRMAVTTPAFGATMSLKVFIASISSSLSPAVTRAPISTKGLASGLGPQIGGADHRRFHRVGMVGRIDPRVPRRWPPASAVGVGAAAGGGRRIGRRASVACAERGRRGTRAARMRRSPFCDLDFRQIALRRASPRSCAADPRRSRAAGRRAILARAGATAFGATSSVSAWRIVTFVLCAPWMLRSF